MTIYARLNLAYYYQNYYYLDLSYLTKSFQICSDIVLETTLEDSIDAHLSCWLLLDDLDYEKDSGSTQKGFYYRVFRKLFEGSQRIRFF